MSTPLTPRCENLGKCQAKIATHSRSPGVVSQRDFQSVLLQLRHHVETKAGVSVPEIPCAAIREEANSPEGGHRVTPQADAPTTNRKAAFAAIAEESSSGFVNGLMTGRLDGRPRVDGEIDRREWTWGLSAHPGSALRKSHDA